MCLPGGAPGTVHPSAALQGRTLGATISVLRTPSVLMTPGRGDAVGTEAGGDPPARKATARQESWPIVLRLASSQFWRGRSGRLDEVF
jgi:hypothetical protein